MKRLTTFVMLACTLYVGQLAWNNPTVQRTIKVGTKLADAFAKDEKAATPATKQEVTADLVQANEQYDPPPVPKQVALAESFEVALTDVSAIDEGSAESGTVATDLKLPTGVFGWVVMAAIAGGLITVLKHGWNGATIVAGTGDAWRYGKFARWGGLLPQLGRDSDAAFKGQVLERVTAWIQQGSSAVSKETRRSQRAASFQLAKATFLTTVGLATHVAVKNAQAAVTAAQAMDYADRLRILAWFRAQNAERIQRSASGSFGVFTARNMQYDLALSEALAAVTGRLNALQTAATDNLAANATKRA